jgi:hypothetical protein
LKLASKSLKNDKGFFMEAVKLIVDALQFASDHLKKDKEFII